MYFYKVVHFEWLCFTLEFRNALIHVGMPAIYPIIYINPFEQFYLCVTSVREC